MTYRFFLDETGDHGLSFIDQEGNIDGWGLKIFPQNKKSSFEDLLPTGDTPIHLSKYPAPALMSTMYLNLGMCYVLMSVSSRAK